MNEMKNHTKERRKFIFLNNNQSMLIHICVIGSKLVSASLVLDLIVYPCNVLLKSI